METVEKPKVSNSPDLGNEKPEKDDHPSTKDKNEEKKNDILAKQDTAPVMKEQFRMIASDNHKTLEYRYTEEVEHTMVMKDGVTWHELKQYDYNPIVNGENVSPNVRKTIVTKSIGDNRYQTSEVITDGVKKIEQLFKLNDGDIENFKATWESNWKPKIDEKEMNENMTRAMQQMMRTSDAK